MAACCGSSVPAESLLLQQLFLIMPGWILNHLNCLRCKSSCPSARFVFNSVQDFLLYSFYFLIFVQTVSFMSFLTCHLSCPSLCCCSTCPPSLLCWNTPFPFLGCFFHLLGTFRVFVSVYAFLIPGHHYELSLFSSVLLSLFHSPVLHLLLFKAVLSLFHQVVMLRTHKQDSSCSVCDTEFHNLV